MADGWRSIEGACSCAECSQPSPIPAPLPRRTPRKRRAKLLASVEKPSRWLGVDVGFIYPAVDSDGQIYRWHSGSRYLVGEPATTHGGPVTVRKADGTVYTRPAYDSAELHDIEARARGEHYNVNVRTLAYALVNKARHSRRGIALEDWSDFRRRRAAWVDVWRKVQYVAEQKGCAVRTVPSAWSSTTCPMCGYSSPGNRPRRGTFRCQSCGHVGQADKVAALNIMARAGGHLEGGSDFCANPVCRRPAFRGGLCCACYFYSRRHDALPDEEVLDELRIAANYAAMKAEVVDRTRPDRVEA